MRLRVCLSCGTSERKTVEGLLLTGMKVESAPLNLHISPHVLCSPRRPHNSPAAASREHHTVTSFSCCRQHALLFFSKPPTPPPHPQPQPPLDKSTCASPSHRPRASSRPLPRPCFVPCPCSEPLRLPLPVVFLRPSSCLPTALLPPSPVASWQPPQHLQPAAGASPT